MNNIEYTREYWQDRAAAYKAQRDELIAVLRALTDDYEDLVKKSGPHRWGLLTVENTRAVLAKMQTPRFCPLCADERGVAIPAHCPHEVQS